MSDLEIEAINECIKANDYYGAFKLYYPLARKGDAHALYGIGMLGGILLEMPLSDIDRTILLDDTDLNPAIRNQIKDLSEDIKVEIIWLTRSAAHGHPEGIYVLNNLYMSFHLGNLPWSHLTGKLGELYKEAENGGYFNHGASIMNQIVREIRELGLTSDAIFGYSGGEPHLGEQPPSY